MKIVGASQRLISAMIGFAREKEDVLLCVGNEQFTIRIHSISTSTDDRPTYIGEGAIMPPISYDLELVGYEVP